MRIAASVQRSLSSLLPEVVDSVRYAADYATRQRGSTTARRRTRKAAGDFVTAVDKQCERLLRRRLLTAMPEAGFLGEETVGTRLEREHVWVVDPIDGTSNYASGLPHWAIAVALMKDRQPALSVIWSEPEGALYTAVRSLGAYRNGRRLRAPRPSWNDGSIIGCQWDTNASGPSLLRILQKQGARVRAYGSTVVQLLDVACGRLDANVQPRGRIWDLAAPALVLGEVGGLVTDWSGKPLFPVSALGSGHHPSLAAMPAVHSILRKRLQRLDPVVSGA